MDMRKDIRNITMNNELRDEYIMIAASLAMTLLVAVIVNLIWSL